MQLCFTKLSVILKIDPYVWYHSILFNERIIEATSNFQDMSANIDWLFSFIYRRYRLPIWATPPEDG